MLIFELVLISKCVINKAQTFSSQCCYIKHYYPQKMFWNLETQFWKTVVCISIMVSLSSLFSTVFYLLQLLFLPCPSFPCHMITFALLSVLSHLSFALSPSRCLLAVLVPLREWSLLEGFWNLEIQFQKNVSCISFMDSLFSLFFFPYSFPSFTALVSTLTLFPLPSFFFQSSLISCLHFLHLGAC